MALEFCDGFDHYTSATAGASRKWDSTNTAGSTSAGRFAGNSWGTQNQPLSLTQGQLTSVATRTVGFACQIGQITGGVGVVPIFQFLDAGTTQIEIRQVTGGGGVLQVTRNGTALATSTSTLTVNTWYYIEFQATIHPTAGSFTLRVTSGGTTSVWASASGVNTRNTSNSTTDGLGFPNAGYPITVDDFYCLNSSGSVNNTFLGESRILTNLPSADDTAATGTNLLWTPNSGTPHFSRANETNPDDDTSYVSSATAGQIDTYKYAAISPTGAIAALQVTLCERKDDVGTRTTCVAYRSSGGTNYAGANNFSPTSSYLMNRQIFETDPATSSAWTASAINNGEFGVKCIA
jgi:hypothetical protein